MIPVRHGISLLEILISIGVVGIGLIGVAALIPLAHHKAAEGVNKDRMSALGRRAFREFKVRGFDRPGTATNPFWFSSSAAIFYPNNPAAIMALPDVTAKPGHVIRRSYCFDPLGVADRILARSTASNGATIPNPSVFPSISSALGTSPVQVSRISVRAETLPLTPMSFAQADRIFRMQDDLQYELLNENKSLPRTQQYLQYDVNGDRILDPVRRLNAGDFSWMATIVPDTRLVANFVEPSTYYPTDSDRYTLSIVVFNRRVLYSKLLAAGSGVSTDANFAANQFNQEIVGRVVRPGESPFTAVGSGTTKEVHITPTFNYREQKTWQSGGPPAGVTWDDVRIGDWVCLIQRPSGQANPVDSNWILRWFQVLGADKPVDGSTDVVLTLTGPNWTFYDSSLSGAGFETFAVHVNNVVNVYEKTIHIHQTGEFAQ